MDPFLTKEKREIPDTLESIDDVAELPRFMT
jgi:hypothetical protein